MKPTLLRLLLLALLALVLPLELHAAEPQAVAQRAEIEESFAAAEAAYRNGDYSQALSRFRSFVLRHHDSELTQDAYAYLGRIFIGQRRFADALLYLERTPAAEQSPETRLLIGYCLIMSGENERGLALLTPFAAQTFAPQDQQMLFEGMALAHERLLEPLRALYFYHRALPGSADREALLENVHRLLELQNDTSLLAEAAFMFHQDSIGQDARLQLARKELSAGDQENALKNLGLILASQTSFPWRREAAVLMDRFSQGSWLQRDTIGVLLPLSGRYEAFGNLVKRGFDLALEQHNLKYPELKLIYRDTEGDPLKARDAAAALANEERVMAILGPLTGSAAIAAAAKAQQSATPLMALSQRASIPEVGPYIFRNSLTARLQARELARYAILQQDLHSFGILAPANRLGREMAEIFTEEVLKLGGLVVDEQFYPEDANDFRAQILHLMGKSAEHEKDDYRQQGEEERLNDLFIPDQPDYPATTFDALFLPDYADRIGLVAPQLAFYGIEDLPLLGINGWNSPDLLNLAGRFVEGAVFVDGFFLDSPYPFVKEFINLFVETYAAEPSILEAQAFDSANILFLLLADNGVTDRSSLREAIANLKNYPGVTGATSFDFTGEADKVLFQLQVKNGRVTQIN